jgi:hypothetical protein
VHLFRPNQGFPVQAQPRLKTDEDKRHFLAEVHIKFLRQPHELQSKTLLEKLQIYFFKYIQLTIFYSIFYQLANKTRNLLFSIQLLIYLIYGDRKIIAIIICHVRRRIRHFFNPFAVVLDMSSWCCCYRLYERTFSYYAPNNHQK